MFSGWGHRGLDGTAWYHPLRLTIDRSALQANWHWLQDRAGVPAGAAVKADAYGLGVRQAAAALIEAGCRTFFVSTWAEAEELGTLPEGTEIVVLHGVPASAISLSSARALSTLPSGWVRVS